MSLLKTSTGTFTSTGLQTQYTSLSSVPTTVYFSVVGKDGGTSVASSSVGIATATTECVSSYGRKLTDSSTEERTDRCIHFFKVNTGGSKTTLLSVSFEGFDTSLIAYGLVGLKYDVHTANSSYSYLARMED